MHPHIQVVFLREVERQARFALLAIADLEQGSAQSAMDRIRSSMQAFLVATGNVAKLLWPTKDSDVARGVELRQVLQVDDGSPLSPRTFRNHFEHFDERLDSWARSSERKNFADSNIGPLGMIDGLDAGDYIRNYDPTTQTVAFRGDVYHLGPVIAALRELHALAKQATPIAR